MDEEKKMKTITLVLDEPEIAVLNLASFLANMMIHEKIKLFTNDHRVRMAVDFLGEQIDTLNKEFGLEKACTPSHSLEEKVTKAVEEIGVKSFDMASISPKPHLN